MSQPDVQSNQNHSSKKAMLLSIIPGLGQWYNQRRIKGSAIFILFLSFTLLMFDYIATGFQGLITLGTIPREHDSRVLLIEGLIALIFTVFYIVFYIAQLNDAKNEAKRIQRGEQPSSVMKRFRQSWDTAFPYVLIGPGFFISEPPS